MGEKKVYRAIGLMSGTSLDGVDAALIETDGFDFVRPLGFASVPYDEPLKKRLRACFGKREEDAAMAEAARAMTLVHIEAVRKLLAESHSHSGPLPGGERGHIDVIGFHGQTVTHDPAGKFTLQIGDAAMLGKEAGIDVVSDFRSPDVKAGGQGAPFLPLYHRARAAGLKGPLAVLNIGGVANVTYIDGDGILAFDTGPGNALMDDFMKLCLNKDFDDKGAVAAKGRADEAIIGEYLSDPFFAMKAPKSLDRNRWTIDLVKDLSVEDGMATLLAMTAGGIERGFASLPKKVKGVYVAGGGRKNEMLMKVLHDGLPRKMFAPVEAVEAIGWNGDALEAEGFAYLAVRSLLGEALSLPETTGVPEPMTGGVLTRAA